ncbi:MAG TPA: pyridoxamine 5'-phosphate oxidase family protein, partial [Nitrososphaerales archaeon]|nr:pyridoxamine 5'-phosphate oxidase family protein [Nitrososphaerales archaeon]
MIRVFSRKQLEYVKEARVGRLATVDRKNHIHVVPIVFANLGDRIYFVLDRKKKSGRELKRIRNISET